MFYKKQGIPEEGEVLLCTVKKVLFHSVFVYLDEYQNLEGMIHISEISPGRIRNIRDFVKEGKKIVCKVLKVNKEKKHIDLSLRRVPLSLRKKKNEEYKQEQKAEKILETLAKRKTTTLEKIYKEFGYKLIEEFDSLYGTFQLVVSNQINLEKEVPKGYREDLIKIIKEKIKPPEAIIEGTLEIQIEDPKGIEIIKKCIKHAYEIAKQKKYGLDIKYLGAPRYKLKLTTTNYKDAEKFVKELTEELKNIMQKNNGSLEFKR